MADTLSERLREWERRIQRAEQNLLGELDACHRRHHEVQAGSPRSRDMEQIRHEMRGAAKEAAAELDRREARLTALEQALEAVLSDAALEDDYEHIHSDGRFISKGALLDCRAALKG